MPRPSIVRNRKPPIALTAALFLVAALIGAGSVFAWDSFGSGDQNDALANVIDARNQALTTAAKLSGQVERLEEEVALARAQATDLEDDVATAQAELLAMLGPALPDGKHFGELYAIGADQDPPRLVIDIEQWFTDQSAVDAAIEDGITVDPGINGYYIRNENPRWRTIEIDPAARVSLTVYPYGQIDDPQVVSLERFADLAIDWSEYWITMEEGKVVAIEQQYIP